MPAYCEEDAVSDWNTRAPSTVGEEDELRAEIKTLKRQLAAETERADGLLLAAQAMSIGANHHD